MSIIRILLTLFVSRSMLESAWADMKFIDLIHAIPTFKPKLNLHNRTKPITQSAPSAGFYQQAILYPTVKFDTSDGCFDSRAILIEEHNGTHLDSTNHYIINNAVVKSDAACD